MEKTNRCSKFDDLLKKIFQECLSLQICKQTSQERIPKNDPLPAVSCGLCKSVDAVMHSLYLFAGFDQQEDAYAYDSTVPEKGTFSAAVNLDVDDEDKVSSRRVVASLGYPFFYFAAWSAWKLHHKFICANPKTRNCSFISCESFSLPTLTI